MLLAINCSNTNSKFGVVDGDRIVGEWRQRTAAKRTADEHAVWLYAAHARWKASTPSRSPTPSSAASCRRRTSTCVASATRYFNCEPLFVGEPDVDPRHQDANRPAAGARAPTGSAIRSVASLDVPADAAGRRRLRHRDELRRRRRGGQLSRRRHRTRSSTSASRPLVAWPRRAAAHRGREAGEGDRHDDSSPACIPACSGAMSA